MFGKNQKSTIYLFGKFQFYYLQHFIHEQENTSSKPSQGLSVNKIYE